MDGTALLEQALSRLCEAVLASAAPIVWVGGIAGSGKTELLRELRRLSEAVTPALHFLDEPTAAQVRDAIADSALRGPGPPRRLVIASRPGGAVEHALLAERLYGRVAVIDDHELFLSAADCGSAGGGLLFAATGGWPMLAAACDGRRAAEVNTLLPEFLELEVLPSLPPELAAALFGAVAEPLSVAAVEHLFGPDARLHPLLKHTDAGVCVASSWVEAALLKLRSKPGVVSGAVLERLIELQSGFADPVRAISALNAIGRPEEALAIFERTGGLFFGFRHGFPACDNVLDSFDAEFENRRESLQLARQYLFFKRGQSREALRRLDANFPRLPVDLRRMQASHRAHAVLLRLDVAVDLDEPIPLEVVRSWGRLESCLHPEDHLARGVLYNIMTLGFLRRDELFQARQLAEDALGAYRRGSSPYLVHYMFVHLADIALRESRLREAAAYLEQAQEELGKSGFIFNSEPVILAAFRERLAYEEGRLVDCPADIERSFEVLEQGDSWPGLIRMMMGYAPFVAYWRDGLRAALDAAEHCMLTLGRRHGPTADHGLNLIRVRVYQIARRHSEGAELLREIEVTAPKDRSPYLLAEEALIQLRVWVAEERPVEVGLLAAKDLANQPDLDTRQRISLGILQASLRQRVGDQGLARRHLATSLRLAAAQTLIGVLLEEAEFLERLLPAFVAEPGAGNDLLGAFARRVMGMLRDLPSTGLHSKAVAGISRQEYRVLVHLSDGHSNKAIARALAVSESAVKFHLRNLFRKLQVERRGELLERARERGLLS